VTGVEHYRAAVKALEQARGLEDPSFALQEAQIHATLAQAAATAASLAAGYFGEEGVRSLQRDWASVA
jgi:hypothetical protein